MAKLDDDQEHDAAGHFEERHAFAAVDVERRAALPEAGVEQRQDVRRRPHRQYAGIAHRLVEPRDGLGQHEGVDQAIDHAVRRHKRQIGQQAGLPQGLQQLGHGDAAEYEDEDRQGDDPGQQLDEALPDAARLLHGQVLFGIVGNDGCTAASRPQVSPAADNYPLFIIG